MLAVLKPVYGLMRGVPTDHPLFSTYWRKRNPPPESMDPDRHGLRPALVHSRRAQRRRKLAGIATSLVLRHGFEPAISMTVLSDRTVDGEDPRPGMLQPSPGRFGVHGRHPHPPGSRIADIDG